PGEGSAHYNRGAGHGGDGSRGRHGPPPERHAHGRVAAARLRVSHHPEDGAGDCRDSTRPVSNRLFGTDGIRGVANEPPLTPDLAYRVGRELGATLPPQPSGASRVTLVICRDTRRSGPRLAAAVVARR